MRAFRCTTLSLPAALIAGTAPHATAQTAQQRAACQGDAKKLCQGVAPGGGRILECLAKQKGSLCPTRARQWSKRKQSERGPISPPVRAFAAHPATVR